MRTPRCKIHGSMILAQKGPNGPLWICRNPKCQATHWGENPRAKQNRFNRFNQNYIQGKE